MKTQKVKGWRKKGTKDHTEGAKLSTRGGLLKRRGRSVNKKGRREKGEETRGRTRTIKETRKVRKTGFQLSRSTERRFTCTRKKKKKSSEKKGKKSPALGGSGGIDPEAGLKGDDESTVVRERSGSALANGARGKVPERGVRREVPRAGFLGNKMAVKKGVMSWGAVEPKEKGRAIDRVWGEGGWLGRRGARHSRQKPGAESQPWLREREGWPRGWRDENVRGGRPPS